MIPAVWTHRPSGVVSGNVVGATKPPRYRKTMSWDGPDREHGPAVTGKPVCTTRPSRSLEDRDAFITYLGSRNLSPYLAEKNGWYASRNAGDSELRVVIPCLSADLANRYWQGRLTWDNKEKFPLRYTSPRHVSRGDALAVVYPDSKHPAGTVLVEGPMDALAAAGVGFLGIGWMGTDPGEEPVAFARKLVVKGKPLYVVSDRDALPAAIRIWSNFVGARLVNPYPFKDLAQMPSEERREYLHR